MKSSIKAVVLLGLISPAALLAADGPRFTILYGAETSINGDVHGGTIAPIANLGPLNPALEGVSAELRIESRSYDAIYGKSDAFGIEMSWPMADGEVFGQLRSLNSGDGMVQVGGAFVPALDTTLPVYGHFDSYDSLALEGGYRYYFGDGKFRPYLAGRIGATRVGSIDADFTIPDAAIALNNVPFFDGGWQLSGGADLGVAWMISDNFSLALEASAQYHGDLDGDDSAIAGLGLGSINDTGSRLSVPVNLRAVFQF